MLKTKTKNSLVINNAVELGELTSEANGKGRKFTSRFIEAGVAHYEQFGDVLITKETLNKFIHTMEGCPVIIKHKDITDKNADKERVGVVSRVWYNDADGWFYCEGVIWDKQAINLVKNEGWNVSCTYDFESDLKPLTHNGKKIDMEFTGGEFLHLALVPNPRYERANIVMNSKETVVAPIVVDITEEVNNNPDIQFLRGLKTIIENSLDSELSEEDKRVINGLAEIFEGENGLGELQAVNEERWITIGADEEKGKKGTHILVKEGETNKEATERKIKEWKGQKGDKDNFEKDIKTLTDKRQVLADEFQKADYYRKKEILQENQNLIQQIWTLRGKQTEAKREKLLKKAGDYTNKLAEITKNSEAIINALVAIEDNILAQDKKWDELDEQRKKLKDEFYQLRILHGNDNELVKLKEKELNEKYKEFQKQSDVLYSAKRGKYKAIHDVLQINTNEIRIKTTTKSNDVKYTLEQTKPYLAGIIAEKVLPKEPIKAMAIQGGNGRCHYSHQNDRLEMTKDSDVLDTIHETMHWLEKKNPKVLENSLTFLEYRTQGEKVQKLRDITLIDYDPDEMAKPDSFFDPYCGKIYNHQATEIMSMGLEEIFRNPKRFAETDREHMAFVISNLRGEI